MNLVTRREAPRNTPCTVGQTPSITLRCQLGSPRTVTRVSHRVDMGRGPGLFVLLNPFPRKTGKLCT